MTKIQRSVVIIVSVLLISVLSFATVGCSKQEQTSQQENTAEEASTQDQQYVKDIDVSSYLVSHLDEIKAKDKCVIVLNDPTKEETITAYLAYTQFATDYGVSDFTYWCDVTTEQGKTILKKLNLSEPCIYYTSSDGVEENKKIENKTAGEYYSLFKEIYLNELKVS